MGGYYTLGTKELTPEDIAMIRGTSNTGSSTTVSAPTTRAAKPAGAGGTGNVIGGTIASGKPIASTTTRPWPGTTGVRMPAGAAIVSGGKIGVTPTAGSGNTIRPASTVPAPGGSTTAVESAPPADTALLPPEAPAAGPAPEESFLSRYKWWIAGGSAALVALGAALLLMRKKTPATSYIPGYEDDD